MPLSPENYECMKPRHIKHVRSNPYLVVKHSGATGYEVGIALLLSTLSETFVVNSLTLISLNHGVILGIAD